MTGVTVWKDGKLLAEGTLHSAAILLEGTRAAGVRERERLLRPGDECGPTTPSVFGFTGVVTAGIEFGVPPFYSGLDLDPPFGLGPAWWTRINWPGHES